MSSLTEKKMSFLAKEAISSPNKKSKIFLIKEWISFSTKKDIFFLIAKEILIEFTRSPTCLSTRETVLMRVVVNLPPQPSL